MGESVAHFDEFGVQLYSGGSIGNGIAIGFGLNVCLHTKSVTRAAWMRFVDTNLCTVCEERRFLVVGFDGLRI